MVVFENVIFYSVFDSFIANSHIGTFSSGCNPPSLWDLVTSLELSMVNGHVSSQVT